MSVLMWQDPMAGWADGPVESPLVRLWSLVVTGELAALRVAADVPVAAAGRWSEVGWDLREASEEIEWLDPTVVGRGRLPQVGRSPVPTSIPSAALLALLGTASDLVLDLLSVPGGSRPEVLDGVPVVLWPDNGGPAGGSGSVGSPVWGSDPDAASVLGLCRVLTLLATVRARLTADAS